MKLSPLDAARAALGLARLVFLVRQRDRARGVLIAGAEMARAARLGQELAQAVAAAEEAPEGSPARREALVRAGAAADELSNWTLPSDGVVGLLRSAASLAREDEPPMHPVAPGVPLPKR